MLKKENKSIKSEIDRVIVFDINKGCDIKILFVRINLYNDVFYFNT